MIIKWLQGKQLSSKAANIRYTALRVHNFKCHAPQSEIRKLLYEPLENIVISGRDAYASKYAQDLEVGFKLYEYLSPDNLGLRYASDDGIWKYLSIEVFPDIVFARWGDNPDHFWKLSRRIWLKSVWWYIHLSWQGGEAETRTILRNLTTDEILQLVERSGRSGYRVDLYREIMRQLPLYRSSLEKKDLFRTIMKLNTARLLATEPSFSQGSTEGYVKRLYDYLK